MITEYLKKLIDLCINHKLGEDCWDIILKYYKIQVNQYFDQEKVKVLIKSKSQSTDEEKSQSAEKESQRRQRL